MHKSKFFETFLNNLQTVSIEYRKRLKKVGILRVKLLGINLTLTLKRKMCHHCQPLVILRLVLILLMLKSKNYNDA